MRRTTSWRNSYFGTSRTWCHASNDLTQTVRSSILIYITDWITFLRRPHERTIDDLEIIYDELLHVKALSHLSSLVKRELAGVLIFEAHPFKGEVCTSNLKQLIKLLRKILFLSKYVPKAKKANRGMSYWKDPFNVLYTAKVLWEHFMKVTTSEN